MAINFLRPAAAQLEVSLFGPGTGECIVAHLGNNEWMVVDSCTNANKEPVAVEYLTRLGVSMDSVKLIVLTHFHDDHIGGAKLLIETCTEAQVFISSALTYDESISFCVAHAQDDVLVDVDKPSTRELVNILKSAGMGDRHLKLAVANKVLYRNGSMLVHALSPSDRAVSQSRLLLGESFLETGRGFRKLAGKLHPNLCAVALHICNGVDTVLLGSDLEVCKGTALGWEAVLLDTAKPVTTAKVFKVPHHGSQNGHSDDVVAKMLAVNPISILTTFNSSSLPRETDIKRIQSYSEALYHTTPPKVRAPSRNRDAEESLKQVAKRRRIISKTMGHIQIRMLNGVCDIELNEYASIAA